MNTRIALILLSALSATVALPSIATATLAADHHEDRLEWNADAVLRRLQDRGVDASSVEQWNGLIRAYVVINGNQVMQYFDPDTLAQVEV
ncbi:MAG: PepSY domain-containing protein [Devosia sp.]